MILCHPQIETLIDFSSSKVPSLVVEEPVFFRVLIQDLYDQIDGTEGNFVLSEDDEECKIGTWVELIDNCLHFSLNSRSLLGKITSVLEHAAVSESYFLKTSGILQQIEQYFHELSFEFSSDIVYKQCTVAGLLKALGVSLREDYDDLLEKLIDYMELVREFERDKLFVIVNLRSFFADDHVERFLETALLHRYRILLLDSVSRKKLAHERRITIDNDLCEF